MAGAAGLERARTTGAQRPLSEGACMGNCPASFDSGASVLFTERTSLSRLQSLMGSAWGSTSRSR